MREAEIATALFKICFENGGENMVKGFVFYRGGKIPFVIEDYRLELFSDDSLLSNFAKEHNFKMNYTLNGQYFRDGLHGQRAIFLVEYSMAGTCYLTCYILYNLRSTP